MKRLFAIIFSLLLLLGCEELFVNEQPKISLDPEQTKSLTLSDDGDSFDVIFTSTMSWNAEIVYSDDTEGWASLNKTSGEGGYSIVKLKIVVQKNSSDKIRSARLVIKSDSVSEEIVFIQAAAQQDSEDSEPDVVFNLSDNSADVPAEGGKVRVTVQYNVDYECTIPVDWIREVKTKSYDEKVHTFEIDANDQTDSRSATISFCGNDSCVPFTINQEAAEQAPEDQEPEDSEPDVVFNLSDGSADVPAEGGKVRVTVQYNVDYECTIPVDWIREVKTKSYDEKVHTFEIDANDQTDSRSATISFCGNDTCLPFVINQDAAEQEPEDQEAVFELSENSAEVIAEGGTFDVTVISNVEYDYTVPVDWIAEITTRTAAETTHTFEVAPNTGTESRTATISFCGNDTCIPFTITQDGIEQEYYLDVDEQELSVEAVGTMSPVTVNVSSNLYWTVTSDSDWCTVNPASGQNDGSFDINVNENTSSDSRIANVTVSSSDEEIIRTIVVLQYPADEEETDDSWQNAEFLHTSLAFRFTADWCGYCPMMATAMEDAQDALPGKLEVISVHAEGSSYACGESEALISKYRISSYPTGLVDGRTYVDNYTMTSYTTSIIIDAVEDTEERYDVMTGASWNSSVSGNKVSLDLSAYIKKSGSYKMTALLVEDKVIGYQADYNSGASYSYEHNGIIRAAFSDVTGESFDISEDGTVKNFTYSASLSSSCNIDNVRVVVYIQRLDPSNNSYYVDNAASAAVGMDKKLGIVSDGWSDGNEGIVPGEDITL